MSCIVLFFLSCLVFSCFVFLVSCLVFHPRLFSSGFFSLFCQAFHVVSCRVLSYIFLSCFCIALSCMPVPSRLLLFRFVLCHFLSRLVSSTLFLPFFICFVLNCSVLPCLASSCLVLFCTAWFWRVLFCLVTFFSLLFVSFRFFLSYLDMPFRSMTGLFWSCNLSCFILSCFFVSFHVLSGLNCRV